MDMIKLKEQWKAEEASPLKGWDFSHLNGRWESSRLPWDYREVVLSILKRTDRLLDMGTGGGEFLLSLGHPYELTAVTESWPPNIKLCVRKLAPLGITVASADGEEKLPFEKSSFDIVINRHESYDPEEMARILKCGGHFITQQVGGANNADLSQRLITDYVPKYPAHTLGKNLGALQKAGFEILKAEEAFPTLRFFDVGALVYFAKAIPWEFPGFSVKSCLDVLYKCQWDIEEYGFVQSVEHRFIIAARKR